MSGQKIIDGLRDAIAGNITRVRMDDGSTWIPEPKWQPIETAPLNKQILMFAETGDVIGGVPNWKIASGYIIDQSQYGGLAREYQWPHRLEAYEHTPTHWMPMPARPVSA